MSLIQFAMELINEMPNYLHPSRHWWTNLNDGKTFTSHKIYYFDDWIAWLCISIKDYHIDNDDDDNYKKKKSRKVRLQLKKWEIKSFLADKMVKREEIYTIN